MLGGVGQQRQGRRGVGREAVGGGCRPGGRAGRVVEGPHVGPSQQAPLSIGGAGAAGGSRVEQRPNQGRDQPGGRPGRAQRPLGSGFRVRSRRPAAWPGQSQTQHGINEARAKQHKQNDQIQNQQRRPRLLALSSRPARLPQSSADRATSVQPVEQFFWFHMLWP